MWARATSNEPLVKALRIALVFLLVFGISFRVEWLAYAATVANEADTAAQHEGEELTELAVYKLDTSGGNVHFGDGDFLAAAVDPQTNTLKLAVGQTVQIAGTASWQAKQTEPEDPDPTDPTEPEDPTPGGEDNPSDTPGGNSGESQSPGTGGGTGDNTGGGGANTGDNTDGGGENDDDNADEKTDDGLDEQSLSTQSTETGPGQAAAQAQTRGIPAHGLQTQEEYAKLASFLQWDVENQNEVNAAQVEPDPETGAVAVSGLARGTATIVCSLPDGSPVSTAEGLAGFTVRIPVEVVPEAYVQSLELFHDGDTALSPTDPVTLTDDERKSFAVRVRVNVYNELTGETYPHDLGTDESFKDKSKDEFDDLKWEVLDADGKAAGDDVATVETKGGGATLALKGDGPVTVRCTSPNGLSGDPQTQEFVAQSTNAQKEESGDIQGDSHPQDTLTVTVNDPYAKADDSKDAAEGEDDEGDAGGSKSSAAADKDPSGESAAKTGKTASTTFTADADSSLVPVDSETGQQGAPLGARTETYTMTIPGEDATTVEGRGSNLAKLLDAVGVGVEEQKRVESIDFISAELGTTSVAWSDLVDVSRDYIIIAPKSYVHELNGKSAKAASSGEDDGGSSGAAVSTQAEGDEEGDGEGEPVPASREESGNETGSESSEAPEADPSQGSSGASSTGLLENTKYRILYNGSLGSANPLSLRYVNQIVVNMGEPEKDKVDPELSISIDYKPVPKGKEAFLSAVPNNKVGASRFGYTWEISTDGGKNWSVYSDQSVQTLRVTTDDPPYGHIGHQFRVKLETDLLDDDGDPRGATSEPVTITDSNEFTVVLDYVPPLAGDTANFEAHTYNLDAGDKVTSWVWEANMGDGWQPIPGATNAPSWSTPTSAVEESDSSSEDDDGAAAIMTYVRVRATTESGRTATSNEQPLTVRVGEAETGPKASDLEDALNNNGNTGTTDPTNNDNTDPDDFDTQPTTPTNDFSVTPIDNVVYDDTQGSLSERLNGENPTDPTVAGDSPTIVVNDNVSKKIKDQQQAIEQQKESTTPGARWTKLDTINPTNDDLQRILADNPFAPFAMPLGLGVVAAGGLEKLLTFRREL